MKFSEVGPPCFDYTSGPPTITSGFLFCFVLQCYAELQDFYLHYAEIHDEAIGDRLPK